MTYGDAIAWVDDMRPNAYTESNKLKWLNILDKQLYKEVVLTHEDSDDVTEPPEEDAVTTDDDLLVDAAYAYDVYVPYLESRIDRENGEDAKFNQSVTIYNAGLSTWINYYNRAHLPNGSTHLMMG